MAGTVTVASKLPWGLTLHLDEMKDVSEPTPLGAITVKRAFRLPKTVTIRGCARPVGEPSDVQLSHGYALTHGVDADFWARWLATHQDFPAVVNGSLFAVEKATDASAETKTNAKVKSGFEPVDPDNIPAEFRAGNVKIAPAA